MLCSAAPQARQAIHGAAPAHYLRLSAGGPRPPAQTLQEGVTGDRKPSSIERIQRLERLERERLEAKRRREERRRQVIAGARPSGGRHDLVDRIEQVTKYPMAAAGIAWLVIGIIVVTTDLRGSASVALVGSLFALWVVVLAEYAVRLVITPDRRGYLRRRWVEPATVAVPAFATPAELAALDATAGGSAARGSGAHGSGARGSGAQVPAAHGSGAQEPAAHGAAGPDEAAPGS
jgi:hypothetical protein